MGQHFRRIAPFVFVPGSMGVLHRSTVQTQPIHELDFSYLIFNDFFFFFHRGILNMLKGSRSVYIY